MALGIVLTPFGKLSNGNPPYGINYAYGPAGQGPEQYQQPFDPQHYTRGEAGFYADTPLGAPPRSFWARFKRGLGLRGRNPTDFEIARGNYPFLPTYSGWINTAQGYVTGSWNPPSGQPADGVPMAVGPLNGLEAQPANVDDVVALMNAHNDRIFALTVISTTAVAVSALITMFRTLKLIREDKREA